MLDIHIHFSGYRALMRIMALNIGLYLLYAIARTLLFLSGSYSNMLEDIVLQLSLPASIYELIRQPWSLLTYMFIHVDFMHILFNMIILFWTGKLFIEYLGNDKFWATFILGGFSGGFLYLLSYLLFPVLNGVANNSHLIGASAGAIAILVGISTLLPDYTVHLLLFGPVRLKYIAAVSILLFFISIPLGNTGGHIAHIGGALFGFLMVRQLRQGRDLTAWMVRFFRFRGIKKSPLKVVRRPAVESYMSQGQGAASQEAIDQILDKINRSGFDSLTQKERDVLYRASEKGGRKNS